MGVCNKMTTYGILWKGGDVMSEDVPIVEDMSEKSDNVENTNEKNVECEDDKTSNAGVIERELDEVDLAEEYERERLREEDKREFKKTLKKFVIKLLCIVVFLIIMLCVLFGVTLQRSFNMRPNVKFSDVVLYERPIIYSDYEVGDVILYKHNGKQYIGRIAALGGSEFTYETGVTEYEDEKTGESLGTEVSTKTVDVDVGSYFVISDDDGFATDSRSFGAIKKENIKGKIFSLVRKRDV